MLWLVVRWLWLSLVLMCMVRLYDVRVVWVCGLFGVVWVKLLFRLMKIFDLLVSIVVIVLMVLCLLWCGILKLKCCFSVLSSVVGGCLLMFMVWLF